MSYSDPGLCRVSLHDGLGISDTGAVAVDATLPAGVPVAALIPPVVDILATYGGARHTGAAGAPYRLSRLGETALDGSKTLAQQAIRDGTVLVLTRTLAGSPSPRFDDPAEQVAACVSARTRPFTPRAARITAILAAGWLAGLGVLLMLPASCAAASAMAASAAGCALIAAMLAHRVQRDTGAALTLGLLAVGFAATAGGAAVPGGPGAANALLAAVAAAAVAVLAVQLAGCGGPAMTSVCCLAVLAAAAALAVVLAGVSPQAIAAATAAASIGLLQAAARVSMAVAGLSRPPRAADCDDEATRAYDLLTGLVAAFSTATPLGAAGAALGVQLSAAPRFGGVAFAAISGAALLLRVRAHTDRRQIAALAIGATAALSAALVAAAVALPQQRWWLCATAAALAGAAGYLGFAAPVLSPANRRVVELLEYLTLAAVVPVACWVCGGYGAARGLSLL